MINALSNLIFADATALFEKAKFVIFGAPYDGTSCFRTGSRWAPNAIREASYNFETFIAAYGVDLAEVPLCDIGDINAGLDREAFFREVEETGAKIARDKKVSIMLGGEHSLTYPCFRGHRKKLKFVVLDAHLDLRNEYMGAKHSHACVSRRVVESVGNENIILIGIRSGAKEEYEFAEENGILYYSADRINSEGLVGVMRALSGIRGDVYLSIDMDAMDPAYAPAVSTPEPFGISPSHVRSIIQKVAPKAVAMDVLEIVPQYDSGNTAILGAKFVREFIAVACSDKKL
jgi:agmatinase